MNTRLYTRLYALLFCLSILLPSSPLFAAWSSVSGNPANWLVAGSGSSLFAADASSVYTSADSGKTWTAVTKPGGSPFSALSFFNGQVWVGTTQQGLAYSGNQGGSWTVSSSGMTTSGLFNPNPTAPQINAVYARSGSFVAATQSGVYLSGTGASWSQTAQGLPATTTVILGIPVASPQPVYTLDATASGTLFAGTDSGIYRSADGGKNWTAAGLSGVKVTKISAAFSTAYAIGDALYKSSDGGATWSKLAGLTVTPVSVLAHPGKDGAVYVGTAQGQVSASSDNGATWKVISDNTVPATPINALAVPPDQADALAISTSRGVFRYTGTTAPKFNFTIPPISGAPMNATIVSAEVLINGLTKAEPISIVGGKYSINGKLFTDQPGMMANGARLKVQLQSSATPNTSTTATVTINSVSAAFVVTTHKIVAPTNLTQVFTSPPTGAQIRPDGSVLISSTTPVPLQTNLPAGIIIETTAGTPLTHSGGTLTFTPQASGAMLTSTTIGTNVTALQVASGTFNVQSTAGGNTIPVGGSTSTGRLVTNSTGSTALTVSTSGNSTSAFVQSGVVYYQSSGSTASTRFAATSGTAVYGGETAEVSNSGSLDRIRIGSLDGDKGIPGDPLTLANVTSDSTIPKLDGNLQRLNNSASLVTVIQDALNTQFGVTTGVASYDSTTGVVTYTVNGKVYRFIPVDVPTVQLGGTVASLNRFAAASPASSASGAFSLAGQGIQVTLASSLGYFTDLNTSLKSIDPNAKIKIRSSGALQLTLNSIDIICTPASNAVGGGATPSQAPGFQLDNNGVVAFQDSYGAMQTLYPILADASAIDETVKALDTSGSVANNGDGTATITLGGTGYILKPEYLLIPLPSTHSSDLWWVDGGKLYFQYSDSTAQGMSL